MTARTLLFSAALIIAGPTLGHSQGGPSMSDVLLTVNDQPVYSWEVSLVIPQIQAAMASQGGRVEESELAQAAMRQVVQTRLLAQEAKRRGLTADVSRVDDTLARIEEDAGGREQLQSALGQAGVSVEQLRSIISEADLVQVFIETVIEPGVGVTDEEVAAFYAANPTMFERPEQVHARHILVKVDAEAKLEERTAARAKVAAARQRVLDGEDFATVAREVSECPSAPAGGDLGFFGRQQVDAAFADAVFALEPNDVSGIVETIYGYHVIRLEERRPATMQSLSQAREPLTRMLRDRRAAEAVDRELQRLAEAATIVEAGAPAGTGADAG